MKNYIFMAVAGMLALSSCSSDDNDQTVQDAPRQMTFTAGFDNCDATRATLSDKTVSFDANDKISILSSKNTNTAFTTSSGGASATFSGTATDDSKFYAVYPYTDGLTLSGDVIQGVVIPTDQWNDGWWEPEQSGWDPSAPIAYATTTGSSLTFHNLCAILKIHLLGPGEDATVKVSADQNLAGIFRLDTSTGTLTATPESSKTLTAGNPEDDTKALCATQGNYIYLAIAPGTYSTFKVVATGWFHGITHEKTKSSVTFEAGKIYDLGLFTNNVHYVP